MSKIREVFRPVCEAHISLESPATLQTHFIAYLNANEIDFAVCDAAIVVELGSGTATMTSAPDALHVQLEARDEGDLAMLREGLASLIDALAEQPVVMRWAGLAEQGATFPNFREIRLVGATNLTPHMRRLTFAGDDLARFASPDDLHVRLYLPPPSVERPAWPRPGPDGRVLWPPDDRRPAVRYYTVRSVDLDKSTIDIDFVLHANAGPGSAFAEAAIPGAVLGMMGPLGRSATPAPWYLLAGDETALPAVARIAESLPSEKHGTILIEVAGPRDEIALVVPPGMSLRWLHRNGAPAAQPDLIEAAVRASEWPNHGDISVWIGCEHRVAKSIRRWLTKERAVPRDRCLVVGYWSGPDAV